MGALSQIMSRVTGGGRAAGRTRAGGLGLGRTTPGTTAGGTGRRTQGEAVGRGLRSLLRRGR